MDALAVAGIVFIERQHFCTECGRFLSASRMPESLPPGMVRSRAYCKRCQKWRWFDVATGAVRAE